MTTRRSFLSAALRATATGAAASLLIPRSALAGWRVGALDAVHSPDPSALRALASRALEAATAAGANYADVRFTFTRDYPFRYHMAVGVRALYDGFWGFVASPEWTPDEMSRLGREAAAQAKTNNWGQTRAVDLGSETPVVTGTWSTPIERDPFTVGLDEHDDEYAAALNYAGSLSNREYTALGALLMRGAGFTKQERTFASTNGSFITQTFYRADIPQFALPVKPTEYYDNVYASGTGPNWGLTRAGGYEVFTKLATREAIRRNYEEAVRRSGDRATPKPVDVGRYTVVFDAASMASIMSSSIGAALQIDRVRGYEANASGTSYLSPPASILGNPLASSLVTITANRSQSDGLASAKWDDDGVTPVETTLLRDGVVTDYLTSREHIGVLADWYHKHGRPLRSNGCAGSGTALDIPLVHTPNLVLRPAPADATFEALVANVPRGIAVRDGGLMTDFQQSSGAGSGDVYEIVNGRIGRPLNGAGYLFRAREFWKNVRAIGGASSAGTFAATSSKGQPGQSTRYSISAVAAMVTEVPVIDFYAKAR